MKQNLPSTGAMSTASGDSLAAKNEKASEPSYTPLDIDDPLGRFGTWMPGDDPDDWR